MTKFTSKIISRTEVARETYEITFPTQDSKFSFIPGQYITLTLPELRDLPSVEQWREFSLCSAQQNATSQISIATRNGLSAFKRALITSPLGTPVEIDGPKGVFTIEDTAQAPLVFIAGGIGITPFMSILRSFTDTSSQKSITLLYFANDAESAPYKEELRRIESRYKNITVTHFYGHASKENLVSGQKEEHNPIFYLAGPTAMVTVVRRELRSAGIEGSRIHTEEFSGYRSK